MNDRRPTIEEVAKHAGVSRGTVSRVVNNAPHVSEDARERVGRAIRELGYIPNRAARSLVTRRHEAVALAASANDPGLFSAPFFAEVLLGVNSVLDDTDLELVLALGGTERGRERLQRQLSSHRVDGVILMCLRGADPLHELISASGVPAVCCGKPLGVEPPYFVDADNRGGARSAAEHLLASGRTRIANITGFLEMDVGVARYEGFRDGLLLAGADARRVFHSDFQQAGGTRAMESLLEQYPDLDAVFAASDAMAVGALKVLREHGRRVPDDVAVVGFDDLPVAHHTDPALTTVRQPINALGAEAARLLLSLLHGDPAASVLLPTTLVKRASS